MSLATVVSDILWNLDIISSIGSHQTLLVDGDKLGFDTRYMQWLRRPMTGDSREEILHAINKTFKLFEEVLHSYQCNSYINNAISHVHQEQLEIADNILTNLKNLMKRKDKVVQGLITLSTFERYNNDSGFKIEMKRFEERMMKLYQKSEQIEQKMLQKLPHHSCCYTIPLPEPQPLHNFRLDATPSPSMSSQTQNSTAPSTSSIQQQALLNAPPIPLAVPPTPMTALDIMREETQLLSSPRAVCK